MKCSICHEHEASVRMVLAVNGKEHVLDLCSHCVQKYREQMSQVGMEKMVESLLAHATQASPEKGEFSGEDSFGSLFEGLVQSVLHHADQEKPVTREREPRKAVEVNERVRLYAKLKAAVDAESYEEAKVLQRALHEMDRA